MVRGESGLRQNITMLVKSVVGGWSEVVEEEEGDGGADSR